MKNISKIFSVFLSLSLVLAMSYCCCIKDALAKQSHACCAQKSSQSPNQKGHVCPKLVSSFGDQKVDQVKTNLLITDSFQIVQADSAAYSSDQLNHFEVNLGPPGSSSEIPLYIHFRNFRI